MFNFEYVHIIKIRTPVSLQTTAIRVNFRGMQCKMIVCLFMVTNVYSLISCRRDQFFFSVEVIMKGIDLGKIPEPNSGTYGFIVLINWSLYLLSSKSSFQVLLFGIFYSKPVMLNLVEEPPRFYLVIFLILSILCH